MQKRELELFIEQGKTLADISQVTGKGKTTIRYWLKQYGLKTTGKAGSKPQTIIGSYKKCTGCKQSKSITEFSLRSDRPGTFFAKCKQCIRDATNNRANTTKNLLVKAFGGACERCSKTFHIDQYDFHHIEPEHKDFNIGHNKHKTLAQLSDELSKCIMLCANCHTHTHHLNKQQDGYDNKIKGNTELWSINKERKLAHIGKCCCTKCGYSEYAGTLSIVFPNNLKHYRKYNKTHWDDDFKQALSQASVLCNNCLRLQ